MGDVFSCESGCSAQDVENQRRTANTQAPLTNTPNQQPNWQQAVREGQIHAAQQLLANDPELLEKRMDDGDLPLHAAVRNNKVKFVVFLLESGADPNLENDQSERPLILAVEANSERLVSLLLLQGADPALTNGDGQSALDVASDTGNEEIIKSLNEGKGVKFAPGTNLGTMSDEDDDDKPLLPLQSSTGIIAGDEDLEQEPILAKKPSIATRKSHRNLMGAYAQSLDEEKEDGVEDENEGQEGDEGGKHALKELAEKESELLELDGWLDKQNPNFPWGFAPRYVLVRRPYMLWDTQQKDTQQPEDAKERKKFGKSLSFNAIRSVEADGKNRLVFRVLVQGRDFVFRAANQEDRDFWVENLMKHKRFHDETMEALAQSDAVNDF